MKFRHQTLPYTRGNISIRKKSKFLIIPQVERNNEKGRLGNYINRTMINTILVETRALANPLTLANDASVTLEAMHLFRRKGN